MTSSRWRCRAGLVVVALALALEASAGGADEPAPVLLSRQLVVSRHLAVGSVVTLAADATGTRARRFRVMGVYEPVPDPMRLGQARYEARLHLDDFLAVSAPRSVPGGEAVDAINVRLKPGRDALAFAHALAARVPGIVALPARRGPSGIEPFRVLERFHQAISAVTVFGSTAFLLALMVMRAEERRETAGILRLLGFSRGRVLLQALGEGLVLALSGAVIGVVCAALTERGVNSFFQWHYDTRLVFVRISAAIALKAVLVAAPLGLLAGLVASWAILRREVVALLRP